MGYVSSGFFTGLTVGRVALADITNKLGERRMVFVYLALSVAMQLMFWFIPNIIANAIVVSFLGPPLFLLVHLSFSLHKSTISL